LDFGTNSEDSVDYPDFVHPLAQKVQDGDICFGIVICGSGNGVNITANKHKGIRSALCWIPEIAALALEHNNANIIALPARYINTSQAVDIINAYLNTSYQNDRHQRRIDKIEL
jgi:ribose 5-phosphate isomerase B